MVDRARSHLRHGSLRWLADGPSANGAFQCSSSGDFGRLLILRDMKLGQLWAKLVSIPGGPPLGLYDTVPVNSTGSYM